MSWDVLGCLVYIESTAVSRAWKMGGRPGSQQGQCCCRRRRRRAEQKGLKRKRVRAASASPVGGFAPQTRPHVTRVAMAEASADGPADKPRIQRLEEAVVNRIAAGEVRRQRRE